MRRLSLIQKVTEQVCVAPRGRTTIDELQNSFPNVTREALQKALTNAAFNGYIHLLMKPQAMGHAKGTTPGVWGPVPEWERELIAQAKAEREAREKTEQGRPPRTVWVGGVPNWGARA